MEKVYGRLTSRQLRQRGRTEATDSAEIVAMNWVLKTDSYDFQSRKKFVWWVLMLTLMLIALLPAELRSEMGISEIDNCTTKTTKSTGVCAFPWKGRGNIFVSATSLLAARAKWVDEEWHTLLEGSQKNPVTNEVRLASALKPGRRAVLTNCDVQVTPCTSVASCGTLTIWKTDGPYNSIVTKSSLVPEGKKRFALGDVTFDGASAVGLYFWQNRTVGSAKHRHSISVSGVEAVLALNETNRLMRAESRPWNLTVNPHRSRLYSITCDTDGLGADDLARGVSLYRAMQLEEPGVERVDVQSNISRVSPVTVNDVVRAAYALKTEDPVDACVGEIDLYEKCGQFEIRKSVYFVGIGVVIALMWLVLHLFVEEDKIPSDAVSWRELAHRQASMLKYFFERAAQADGTGQVVELSEYNEDDCILRFSSKKYAFCFPESIRLNGQCPGSKLKSARESADESV